MKLQHKMILAFCLFIIGPFLAVGWASSSKTSATIKEEVGKTMLQLVKQNHAMMENTLISVRDKTITFLDNYFFSNSSQLAFWTNISTLGEMNEADAILGRWSSDGTEYALYLKEENTLPVDATAKNKGIIYLSGNTEEYPPWAEETLLEKGAGTVRLASIGSGSPTVLFTRAILHPEKYDETLGFLAVSKLEVLLMKNMIAVQLPKDAAIFLYDSGGELLMQYGEGAIAEGELPASLKSHESDYSYAADSHAYLYAVSYESRFGTRLVYKIPLASITGNQAQFQRTITIMMGVYLLFVLLFVLYVLRDIIKPLGKLVMFTRVYEPGRRLPFDMSPPRQRMDEFGLLHQAFIRMTQRLDQSIEENYGMQIKQKEQELSTLHSQITPHLLYNTLDSIYWYALDSGNQDVGAMVKDLSKLLRIGLSKGKSIITVSEEMEHVQAYIRLQMKRYPGVFEVFWDVDEGLENCMVPKVVIQPLVENAIFHGVQSMDGEGQLWVRVKNRGEELHILVEDNGFIPVDVEKLRLIVNGELRDKGYGIRNVHQRIQLHYGEAYGLEYRLRPEGGLIASIVVPFRVKE
ncbi:sensor histidine kinase [Paenibacillus sp. YN15]|uniref:sensor histidine kinase n=1 Tax=Paenibacillus sp. YN15 TaxID=1742774 RepID=UPI0015EBBF34|nr:histidine kinase [Paenibacillus sp. YN15]